MCPLVVGLKLRRGTRTQIYYYQSDFFACPSPLRQTRLSTFFSFSNLLQLFTFIIKTFPKALMELFHGTSQPMLALSHYESIELDVAT